MKFQAVGILKACRSFESTVSRNRILTMDKHPKEMTNKELVNKLKEDGVNTKAVNTVVGEKNFSSYNFYRLIIIVKVCKDRIKQFEQY